MHLHARRLFLPPLPSIPLMVIAFRSMAYRRATIKNARQPLAGVAVRAGYRLLVDRHGGFRRLAWTPEVRTAPLSALAALERALAAFWIACEPQRRPGGRGRPRAQINPAAAAEVLLTWADDGDLEAAAAEQGIAPATMYRRLRDLRAVRDLMVPVEPPNSDRARRERRREREARDFALRRRALPLLFLGGSIPTFAPAYVGASLSTLYRWRRLARNTVSHSDTGITLSPFPSPPPHPPSRRARRIGLVRRHRPDGHSD